MSTVPENSTILIIDDNPDTVQLLSAMVRGQGSVLFALDGETGLSLAKARKPQLILLDLHMGELNGLDVCKRITGDDMLRGCAVIIVTADNSAASEVACFEAGAVDFISKPLNVPVVQARVRTHLRLQAALDSLNQLAIHDTLTGLYNRRHFDQRVAVELARHRRQGGALGLALIDIDHFKLYNDMYGHQLGDRCLQEIAIALDKGTQRPGEFVARYGGEEFVALLPYTGQDGMKQYGEWICNKVRELAIPHAASPVARHITISVGLSWLIPDTDASLGSLIGTADQALYRAKAKGRNQFAQAYDD